MSESSTGIVVRTLPEVLSLAELLWKSNLFPGVANAAQAVGKILLGGELGFGAMASMHGIHVIEGRLELGAELRAALIKRSDKYDYAVLEHDDTVCAIEFYERDGNGKEMRKGTKGWKALGTIRYTLEEAKAKGWTHTQSGKHKGPWKAKPRNMLFANALNDGFRFHTPDLSSGIFNADLEPAELVPETQPPKHVEATVTPPEPARLTNGQPDCSDAEDVTYTAKDASELAAWINDQERQLIEEGVCVAGSLSLRVTDVANKAGFAGKILEWSGPALAFGVQEGLASVTWLRKASLAIKIDGQCERLKISSAAFTRRLKEKFLTDNPFALSIDQLADVLSCLKNAPSSEPVKQPAA